MKASLALISMLAASLLGPLPAFAQDWVDIKDPAELRALHSNKTHRARTYVAHYRADGQGITQAKGSEVRIPRTWQVQGSQVCIGRKDADGSTCFSFQRSAKNPAEIVAVGERRGQRVMLWFTVEDGIPKF